MAVYRYIAVDLLTHTELADLPLQSVTWGQQLNGAGMLRANLPLPALPGTDPISGLDHRVIARLYNDAATELRRALYVERDGVLVFGGPIWFTDKADPTQIKVQAADWWSMFAMRRITADLVYAAQDQLAIAQNLVAVAQFKPGGDLQIATPANASGVLRDRTYNFYEAKPIGEAVEQLAAVDNGFDFAVEIAYDASGNFTRTFRTYYPRRGRVAGDTGHVFELGRNIESIGWPSDGTKAANSLFLVGAGEGADMLRSLQTDPDQFAAGYPLLETSLSFKDIKEQATLDGRAVGELSRRSIPVALPPIVVRGDTDPSIGAYIPGDDARIRVQANTDARWPDGLDTFRRIVAFDVKVDDDGGAEHVTITTDQLAAA